MAGTYTLPGVLLSGVHSSRPAASAVASGTLFAETDTGQTYQSDGVSTWTAWGAVAGGGGGGGGGGLVLLEQHTASGSATLDFTSFVSSTYDMYLIVGVELAPDTNGADLLMEMGTGGGPTYDTAGGNYEHSVLLMATSGGTSTDAASTTAIPRIFKSMSNNAGYGFGTFNLTVTGLQSTAHRKLANGLVQYVNSGPTALVGYWGMDWLTTGTAVTAIRFIMPSGNIASGTIRVYGLAKS